MSSLCCISLLAQLGRFIDLGFTAAGDAAGDFLTNQPQQISWLHCTICSTWTTRADDGATRARGAGRGALPIDFRCKRNQCNQFDAVSPPTAQWSGVETAGRMRNAQMLMHRCRFAVLQRLYVYAGEQYSVCAFRNKGGWNYHAYQIAFFVTSYVIPLLLICGLYVCMLMRLWRGVAPGMGGRVAADSRRKKRVSRMVIIVVVIFAVCWCPIQLVLVLKSLEMYKITPLTVMIQITSHVLAYMNSCVNPILYAFLSDNFRKVMQYDHSATNQLA